MENGKESVYPSEKIADSGHPMLGAVKVKTSGITKREYFAGQIAIGLSVQAIAGGHNSLEYMEKDVPVFAVRIADALLAELEKSKSE